MARFEPSPSEASGYEPNCSRLGPFRRSNLFSSCLSESPKTTRLGFGLLLDRRNLSFGEYDFEVFAFSTSGVVHVVRIKSATPATPTSAPASAESAAEKAAVVEAR